jgi:hypothetical protein
MIDELYKEYVLASTLYMEQQIFEQTDCGLVKDLSSDSSKIGDVLENRTEECSILVTYIDYGYETSTGLTIWTHREIISEQRICPDGQINEDQAAPDESGGEGDNSFKFVEDGLCPNSLNLNKIGDGYYTKINNFSFQFYNTKSNTLVNINLPSLCIQVSGIDFFDGNIMSNDDIKKGIANSIETARRGILLGLNSGLVPPFEANISVQFKAALLLDLKLEFSGLPSINTSATGCPGVANSNVSWNCN